MTLAFIPLPAEASINSVTLRTSRDYENAAGYTYAEITIHGSVARVDGSVGLYSVPAVIIYPRPGRGNGVGVVDWLNSAFYHFFPATTEFGTLQFTPALPESGNHAPVIMLASETDMLVFHPTVLGFGKSAFFTRNAGNPGWRQYEMAGISHLPEPILPLGLPNQNTADARPVFRAAFDNLTRWTHGTPPPDARYFGGSVDATDAFIPITDRDGHFTGGVRLPHVESTVQGHVAGAPLGRHMPLNPLGLDPFHPFVYLSGTFTRFSDDELLGRYGSRHQYVKQVQRAADHLAANRYITNKDRNALTGAAEDEPLPSAVAISKERR